MARATGLAPRRGYLLDATTVLVGEVKAGARGRPAETRTGAARLLTTNLAAQNTWKLVAFGQSSNSAGGYILQAAHVAEGAALSAASAYANIGVIAIGTGQSNPNEVVVGGKQIRDAVRVAGSLTGDVRVTAVRVRPGTGNLAISNVALASNKATITLAAAHTMLVGEVVTVGCSNPLVNGTFTITEVTSTTFSYTSTQSNITSASATGTVTNGAAVPVGTNTVALVPTE
jgi:hypothetical protein